MKQIIIKKNPLIKELTGSRVSFSSGPEKVVMIGGKVFTMKIPFSVTVLSGGTMDMDFKVSRHLAENGVNLLGAYWENNHEIVACFMPLEDTEVHIDPMTPVLIGTLVQVVSFRQTDGELLGATLVTEKSGGAIVIEPKTEERKSDAQARKARKSKKNGPG